MAKNLVRIENDGLIMVIESGYQTTADLRQLTADVAAATRKVSSKHNQILILVDLTRMSGNEAGAELEALKVLKVPFDAMAMYTKNKALKILVNTLLAFNYNRKNIRVFNSAKEAKQWLYLPGDNSVKATSAA